MDRFIFSCICDDSLKYLASHTPTDLSTDGLRYFIKSTVSRYFAEKDLKQPIIQVWDNDTEFYLQIEYPWEHLHCRYGLDKLAFYRRAAEARRKPSKTRNETCGACGQSFRCTPDMLFCPYCGCKYDTEKKEDHHD